MTVVKDYRDTLWKKSVFWRENWMAEHCSTNAAIWKKVATALRENEYKEDSRTGAEV